MKILFVGDCRNEKSLLMGQIAKKLAGDGSLCYLAIVKSREQADFLHIAQHPNSLDGWSYEAIESRKQLHDCFQQLTPESTVLVDSVTAFFTNEMFGEPIADRNAAWRTAEELRCLGGRCANVIYLSDNIFCDAGRYEGGAKEYRKGLAQVNRVLAEQCDTVVEVYYGFPNVLKGRLP